MKKTSTLIILICTFISCSQQKFSIFERQDDINSIIITIIEEGRLNIGKNNIEGNKISQFLKRYKLITHTNNNLPPNIAERKLSWILDFSSQKTFTKKDTKYLLSQNTDEDSLEISKTLKENYKYSTISDILKERKEGKRFQYYTFYVPVFSEDNKTAYIEYDYHYERYFGQGMAFILKKEDNKWKIVEEGGTWIN